MPFAQSISCQGVFPAALERAGIAAALLLLHASAAGAAEPRVPYVPTPQEVVERMLKIAKVGPADYLIDLGSGDGRIVITAAKKYGTRGFGVDINPDRIRESNENARSAGVTDRVSFHQQDLFATDLGQATVITMYLLPRVNIELRPKLLKLAPGTRLVSHDFDMADWKPDVHLKVEAPDKYSGAGGQSDIYYWVVPAPVEGVWQWQTPVGGRPQSYEVKLQQKYQAITGSAWVGSREGRLQGARLRGADIRFRFTVEMNGAPVKHEFSGKVEGDAIHGSATLSGARVQGRFEWNARRATASSTGQRGLPPGILHTARGATH